MLTLGNFVEKNKGKEREFYVCGLNFLSSVRILFTFKDFFFKSSLLKKAIYHQWHFRRPNK